MSYVRRSIIDDKPHQNTKKRRPWYLSCLIKITLAIWLLLIGGVIGIWAGVNLVRTYPTLVLPPFPNVSHIFTVIPGFSRSAQASDGIMIKVISVERSENVTAVSFEVTNNSSEPFDAFSGEFFLLDGQNRRYETQILSMVQLLEPINPGISRSFTLPYEVPGNIINLSFNYHDASVSLVGL